MMARVRVSFTVTALSRVAVPNPHMLSQVAAAAVTEEVSLTAVPAKMPKASPEVGAEADEVAQDREENGLPKR